MINEYFLHKNVVLLNNDILENVFDKEFIDLIVTSPPYNVGIEYNSNDDELSYEQYLEFSEKWLKNCYKWSKPQARFCLNIPLDKNKNGSKAVGADLTQIAQKVGWKYKSTIVWNEGNISRRTAWGSWKSASAPVVIAPVELIVILYKEDRMCISDLRSLRIICLKKRLAIAGRGFGALDCTAAQAFGTHTALPLTSAHGCLWALAWRWAVQNLGICMHK